MAAHSKDFVVPMFSSPSEFVTGIGLPAETAKVPLYPRFAQGDMGTTDALKVNTKLSGNKVGTAKGKEWLFEMRLAPNYGRRPYRLDLETGKVTR